jgi:bifunctional DNA-binding transcriptional regulator/antitoxin component of YhaV-PrlF toxin-antitoxin module
MSSEMNPYEITIAPDGTLTLPLGLLAQAGIDPGATLVATSPSDGRIILRRFDDVAEDLLRGLPPI